MGLFNRKPSIPVCDMCGKTSDEGCGFEQRHVEQITLDSPTWLPAHWRAQAVGEYTWLCTRCNSFPEMKWPHTGGAAAGMTIHLGKAHRVGMFNNGGTSLGPSVDMRRVGQ
jgi:hypothetical protein